MISSFPPPQPAPETGPAQGAHPAAPAGGASPGSRSAWSRQGRRALRNPLTVLGLIVILGWIAFAALAPVLTPTSPNEPDLAVRLQAPSTAHPFGTDQYGRDILVRTIYGARISMGIGLISVGISLAVGLPLGAAAGYYGGGTEQVIMRVMDMVLAFPALVLAMAIAASVGRGLGSAMVAVGLVGVPDFARLMHAQTLSLRQKEYVEAAHAIGAGDAVTILRHIVPNALSPIVVRATLGLGFAVLTAASLSFLGLGVKPPEAEWGAMVADGREFIVSGQWWISTFPGLAIMSAVSGFNLLGDGLRDLLDPRLHDN